MRQEHPSCPLGEIRGVQQQRPLALLHQFPAQAARQRHPPILAAFAVAHHDLAANHVHILDPQPQAFQQPHPAAVQQPRHQPTRPLEHRQQARDLLDREHHRNPPRPLGAHQILHPGQFHAQNITIEEQQRRQRLILRSGRDLSPGRQIGQERFDLGLPHLRRMPLAVGQDEAPYPAHIRLLGAQALARCAGCNAEAAADHGPDPTAWAPGASLRLHRHGCNSYACSNVG